MPDAPKPNWIAMIGGTVMGLLTGSLTMYSWLEHRIEARVEAKVMTEVRLTTIESTLKSNKDAAWTADAVINQRIDTLQDHLTRMETKQDTAPTNK